MNNRRRTVLAKFSRFCYQERQGFKRLVCSNASSAHCRVARANHHLHLLLPLFSQLFPLRFQHPSVPAIFYEKFYQETTQKLILEE